MHYFLTGDIQIGKSTLIRKVLAGLPGVSIGGFRTLVHDTAESGRTVHLLGVPEDAHCTVENCVGACGAPGDAERFNAIGCRLLEDESQYQMLLMDEIGKMERHADAFLERIAALLEGNVPILGVVRMEGNTPQQERIRAHKNVRLIRVTRENRDSLAPELLERLQYELNKSTDSAGLILFRHRDGKTEVLMLDNHGHGFSFPKGHIERGETPETAALRELREETGLRAVILPSFRCEVPSGLPMERRRIIYFLGEAETAPFCPRPGENAVPHWVDVQDVQSILRFPQDLPAFEQALARYVSDTFGCGR